MSASNAAAAAAAASRPKRPRPNDSEDSHAATKKARSEPQPAMDEQSIAIMRHQNKAIKKRLKEKNRDIDELQDKLSKAEQRQTYFDATLSTVNRAWDQLSQDLSVLLRRVDASSEALGQTSASGDDTSLLTMVRKASTGGDDDGDVEMGVDDAQLRAALEARAGTTKRVLEAITSAIEKQGLATTELLRTASSGNGQDAMVGALQKEMEASKAALDEMQAQYHATVEQLSKTKTSLESQLTEATTLLERAEQAESELRQSRRRVDNLEGRVEHLTQQVDSLQRELSTARQATEDAREAAAAAASSSSSAVVASATAPAAVNGEAVHAELEELKATLKERDEMLRQAERKAAREHEIAVDLHAELTAVKHAPLAGSRIMQSSVYVALHERWSTDLKRIQQRDATIRQLQQQLDELATHESRLGTEVQKLEQQYREAATQAIEKERKTYEELVKVRAELKALKDRANTDGKTGGAARSSAAIIENLKVQLSQMNSELRRLREQRQREKPAPGTEQETIAGLRALVAKLQKREQKLLNDERKAQHMLSRLKHNIPREKRAQAEMLEAEEKLRQELKEARDKAAELQAALDVAQSGGRVAELERQVQEARQDSEANQEAVVALSAEIESMANQFGEVQLQNDKLMQEITHLNETASHTDAADLRRRKKIVMLLAARDEAKSKAEAIEADNAKKDELLRQLEAQQKAIKEQSEAALGQSLLLKQQLEQVELQQADLRQQLQAAQGEIVSRDAIAKQLQTEVTEERNKRLSETEKLEKKLAKAEKVASRARAKSKSRRSSMNAADDGGDADDLKEEVNHLREKVICSICSSRDKNVVITKCFHMFCKKCIDDRLAARARKCPRCSRKFGQNDVEEVFV